MKRIPQLDAVRGLAVLLVLVHNTDIYPTLHLGFIATNGWMGVDLFFVLSGFLITGILLDTKNSSGYFKNFYIRRSLRIWPLYYSALFFMFIVVPVVRPAETSDIFGPRSGPWWAYLIFLQNYLVKIPTQALGLLGATWSLGVEEQFYLAWPLIVRFCSTAQLRMIALGVIFISPALRFYLSIHGAQIYFNPPCRLDGLMAGALLALLFRSKTFAPTRFVKTAWIVLFVSAPLAVMIDRFDARWIDLSLVALASCAFVYLGLFSGQKQLRALLGNRFLIYTGTISYGIYLLEKIPEDIVKVFHFERTPFLAFGFTVIVTYAMAALSWNVLEKPFLKLKKYFNGSEVPNSRVAAEARGAG